MASLLASFFCRETAAAAGTAESPRKTVPELARGMAQAVTSWRLACLIVSTGLFWAIQGQLYATMPIVSGVFTAIGILGFLLLMVFLAVADAIDRRVALRNIPAPSGPNISNRAQSLLPE